MKNSCRPESEATECRQLIWFRQITYLKKDRIEAIKSKTSRTLFQKFSSRLSRLPTFHPKIVPPFNTRVATKRWGKLSMSFLFSYALNRVRENKLTVLESCHSIDQQNNDMILLLKGQVHWWKCSTLSPIISPCETRGNAKFLEVGTTLCRAHLLRNRSS
jgi:hypothetical protein